MEVFRGYRSLTVALSGCVGIATAILQAVCISRPAENVSLYLWLWASAAAINLSIIGIEMGLRARRSRTSVTRHTTMFAIEQFLPCIAAGGLITLVIAKQSIDSAWMLPGLWAVLFSLGVFASCRLLPRPVLCVALWYLVCGVLALFWGQGPTALSPWSMGITFGGGQLLAAAMLYTTLERKRGQFRCDPED